LISGSIWQELAILKSYNQKNFISTSTIEKGTAP
jgi:hypothetical protein